jgi:hypothetical protein
MILQATRVEVVRWMRPGRGSGIDRGDDPELATYLRIEALRQAPRSPGYRLPR